MLPLPACNVTNNTFSLTPPLQSPFIINPDTGASGTFLTLNDSRFLSDVQPVTSGIRVTSPDGSTTQSTHTGTITLQGSRIPAKALIAHVFPDFAHSLLSIGQLCDNGMKALYEADRVTIYDSMGVVLSGNRCLSTGLWTLDLSNQTQYSKQACHSIVPDTVPPGFQSISPLHTEHANTNITITNQACNTIALPHSTKQLVEYYYRTFGNLPVFAFVSAVSSGFISLPGLTVAATRKYSPNLTATAKGHLDRKRQGLNSTKPTPILNAVQQSSVDTETEWFRAPVPEAISDLPELPTAITFKTIDTSDRCYADLTAEFPVASIRGNQYVMVFYHAAENYIHAEALPSRSKADCLKAFTAGVEFFRQRGVVTHFMRLDN